VETIVERPGALDVHKAHVTACVRVPAKGGREQHIAEFPTTVAGLLELRDWLAGHGVTQVVMEATGVYWIPRTTCRTQSGRAPPSTSGR
jgi:transposase